VGKTGEKEASRSEGERTPSGHGGSFEEEKGLRLGKGGGKKVWDLIWGKRICMFEVALGRGRKHRGRGERGDAESSAGYEKEGRKDAGEAGRGKRVVCS